MRSWRSQGWIGWTDWLAFVSGFMRLREEFLREDGDRAVAGVSRQMALVLMALSI